MGAGAALVFLGARMTMGRGRGREGASCLFLGARGRAGAPTLSLGARRGRELPRALPRLVAEQQGGRV